MRDKTRHRGARRLAALALLALPVSFASSASAEIPPDAANHPLLQPIDAQNWVDQGELTWAAYKPVPDARPEFYDGSADGSQSQYKTAIILIDYPDQPFLITQPAGTHPFGNPQPGWTPVAPGDVNQWMHDYYAVPNQYNGGKTLNSYWMEDSHGRIGVDVDVFGPYTMSAKSFEYGIASDFNGAVGNQANSSCPAGSTCNRNIRTDGGNAWRAAIGCASGLCGYDNAFYVTAGHDESSTWQEFGEMLWTDREQVPAKFGPPGAEDGPVLNSAGNPIPNWAPTRYVPWTSWRAAANHWPNAGGGTSTQAESSGQSVFAHEFSHLRGLPDNYNNPFADNQRAGTGYWEMMSRGTFNGPGGTHNRWQVPNQGGSALGPHHMLAYKNRLGVLLPEEQLTLERNTLAHTGCRGGDDPGARVGTGLGQAGRHHRQLRDRRRPGRELREPGPGLVLLSGHRLSQLPRRGRRPGRERLVRPRPRDPDLEGQEQRHAERVADRPEPAGHRDDRLLPAGRNAGRGRPR